MNRNERRRLKKLNKGKAGHSAVAAPPVLSMEMVDALEAAIGHHQGGRLNEAEALYRKVLGADPGNALANHLLGNIAYQRGDMETAIDVIGKSLIREPGNAEAHNNLGNALMGAGRVSEAEQSYRRALDLKPDYPEARNNLGLILKDGFRLEEAEEAFRDAIRLKPGFADAHNNLGMVLLLQGSLEEGFAECEWRTGLASMQPFNRDLPGKPWTGEDLTGKRLLVHAEQGLGDTLQFVRYLPLLAERGCELTFECQPSMVRLLSQTEGVTRVIGRGEGLPEIDLHVSLMSLPHLFATTLETVPAEGAYLVPDPDLAGGWRERLGTYQGLRVGLVWRGGTAHQNDKNRSASLELFEKHFTTPGVSFFSLQKELPHHERSLPPSLIDIGRDFQDFADTAAALSHLDLVIAVDTAVAHLAGAMGIPTWVLLPNVPDWRWLLGRDDCPWYPGVRLYRQAHAGDWEGLLEEVEKQLVSEFGSKP